MCKENKKKCKSWWAAKLAILPPCYSLLQRGSSQKQLLKNLDVLFPTVLLTFPTYIFKLVVHGPFTGPEKTPFPTRRPVGYYGGCSWSGSGPSHQICALEGSRTIAMYCHGYILLFHKLCCTELDLCIDLYHRVLSSVTQKATVKELLFITDKGLTDSLVYYWNVSPAPCQKC